MNAQFPQGVAWIPPQFGPATLVELLQRPYDAQSSRRNMSPGPIFFINAHTSQLGIRLSDAIDQNLQDILQDPHAEVLNENVGQKLSYRLQFEGYDSFSRQKYCRTTGRDVRISRAKMAKQVAEVVQAFIAERGPIGPNAPNGLHFGEHSLKLEDLYLLAVDHVTTGSLQPRIASVYQAPFPVDPHVVIQPGL